MLNEDGRVSLPGTPYLAGSAVTMDKAIQNTVRFVGVTLEDAIAMASSNAARLLGHTPPEPSPPTGAERSELRIERTEASEVTDLKNGVRE